MSGDIIRTFKLNFDGTFDEIAYENVKEVFTIVNILAIYIQKIKKMYIWIGKNATQSLKNHISRIRVSLKEDFPQFRILRNITFDMRSEPFDFFDNLNITKDELYEQINYQERIALPILQRIDGLKKNSEKLIKSEDYGKAITSLEEIIELARKIEDGATIIEQKRRIADLTQKHENKKIISKVEEEILQAEKQYNELIKTKNILGAHEVVETFIKNHETIYDLLLIPAAQELILKEKKRWKSEKTKLAIDLSKLEKNFNSAIKKMEIENATEFHDRGINLISPLIDDDTRQKWEGFERKLQDAKLKVEFIEKYDNLIEESIVLKEKHLYEELKQKIENIKKEFLEVDLPDYHNKLDKFQIDVKLAEGFYRTTISGIEELEKRTVIDQKNKNLDEVVKDCLTLINHAKSINSFKTIERYQIILEETEKEIEAQKKFEEEQENLRKELSKLEKNLITALNSMKLSKSREILEKGKKILSELIDDQVKKKWNYLEKKFVDAKQLLNNIEELSKNGMEALINRSCPESLEFFEQIISQMQKYNIGE